MHKKEPGTAQFLLKLVPGAGLEPARPQWPGDFKSPVSTNFTTRAESEVQRARRIPRGTAIQSPETPFSTT